MHRLACVIASLVAGLAACSDVADPPPTAAGPPNVGSPGCTAMACEDGLNVAFSVAQPGGYVFNLVADDASISCSATLPLPPCSAAGSTCGDPRVGLLASGCALPPAEHSLEGLSLSGMHPQTLSITVMRDGEQIASESLTPTYEILAPNGEECGPICETATTTLALE